MKKYNKNTLVFKVRAWLIVILGILQVINYIIGLCCSNSPRLSRYMSFFMFFAIVVTVWEIRDKFLIFGRSNALSLQTINFIYSLICMVCVWCENKVIVLGSVVVIELLIIIGGISVIYRRTYQASMIEMLQRRYKRKKKLQGREKRRSERLHK